MTLSDPMIASICDYADNLRAEGISWEGILGKLVAADRNNDLDGLTESDLRQWHAASQKKNFSADADRQRKFSPIGDTDFAAPGDDEPEPEAERTISVSEAAVELVKYLGKDLLAGRPTWQFSRYRRLNAGEMMETIRGPGEADGVKWLKSAVIIRRVNEHGGLEMVECFPEHRARATYQQHGVMLEEFTLSNTSSAKICQKLLEIEIELGANPAPHRRKQLQFRRQNLERRVNTGKERSGITALKIRQIISRLAAVIDIYCPELAGIGENGKGNGAKLARATGRTRAAQSAVRIKIEEELAPRSAATNHTETK